MINSHIGQNAWAQWKFSPWLGMDHVTDAYLADTRLFHFGVDSSHVDIWHPQKGSTDLPVESTQMQFNNTGWNGTPSYLSGMQFRQDALALPIAGSDAPFSMAFEIQPVTTPANSMLFWANAGTNNTKFHALQFNGTNANLRVVRGDGTITKTGSVVPMVTNSRNVLVHVFTGTTILTRINGAVVDNFADLDVGPIAMTHWALSEAFTTGISSVSSVGIRTLLLGNGFAWSPTEIAIIESALRTSAGA